MLLRASELSAEDYGRVHVIYSLRERDVAFYAGERQVKRGDRPEVNTVEEHFRGSKGDQGRKGVVLVRIKSDGHNGGEVVNLLLELYRMDGGRWD